MDACSCPAGHGCHVLLSFVPGLSFTYHCCLWLFVPVVQVMGPCVFSLSGAAFRLACHARMNAPDGCLLLSCSLWVLCCLSLPGAQLLAWPGLHPPLFLTPACSPAAAALQAMAPCVLSLSRAALCLARHAPTIRTHGCLLLSCRVWMPCVLSLFGATLCCACPAPTAPPHVYLFLSCRLWAPCMLSACLVQLSAVACHALTTPPGGCLRLSCRLWVTCVLSLPGVTFCLACHAPTTAVYCCFFLQVMEIFCAELVWCSVVLGLHSPLLLMAVCSFPAGYVCCQLVACSCVHGAGLACTHHSSLGCMLSC